MRGGAGEREGPAAWSDLKGMGPCQFCYGLSFCSCYFGWCSSGSFDLFTYYLSRVHTRPAWLFHSSTIPTLLHATSSAGSM